MRVLTKFQWGERETETEKERRREREKQQKRNREKEKQTRLLRESKKKRSGRSVCLGGWEGGGVGPDRKGFGAGGGRGVGERQEPDSGQSGQVG